MWRYLLYCWAVLAPIALDAQVQWAYRVHTFSLDLISDWESARMLLGEPDKLPLVGKTALPEERPERETYLKVGFSKPVKPTQVLISGMGLRPEWVEYIYIYDRSGKEVLAFRAKDRDARTSGEGGLLHLYLRDTKVKAVGLKIIFQQKLIEYPNLIDAVGVTQIEKPWVPAVRLTDLYKVVGTPSSLGPNVNSGADEIMPRLNQSLGELSFARRPLTEEGPVTLWRSRMGTHKSWSEAITLEDQTIDHKLAIDDFAGFDRDGYPLYMDPEMKRELAEFDQRRPRPSTAGVQEESNFQLDPYIYQHNLDLQIVSRSSKTALGKRDLYYQYYSPGTGWSKPVHMGPIVNSIGDEGDPFLNADGSLLFFSSNGFSGFGGRDIFVSKRLDESWQNWSEPENLGPVINSPWDDAYFTMTSKDMVFFSTDKAQPGNMDIYRLKIEPQELAGRTEIEQSRDEDSPLTNEEGGFQGKETPQTPAAGSGGPALNGNAQLDNGEARPDLMLSGNYFDRETGRAIRATIQTYSRTNPDWGMKLVEPGPDFSARVAAEMECELLVKAEGYFSETVRLIARDEKGNGSIHRNIFLTPLKEGKLYRLENIYFDVNSAILRDASEPTLDDWVEIMIDQPGLIIEVQGHTNDRCSPDYCRQLSRERAKAVVDYFRSKGVSGKRLHFSGFGSSIPVSSNDFEEGRQKNQRVEIKILRVR